MSGNGLTTISLSTMSELQKMQLPKLSKNHCLNQFPWDIFHTWDTFSWKSRYVYRTHLITISPHKILNTTRASSWIIRFKIRQNRMKNSKVFLFFALLFIFLFFFSLVSCYFLSFFSVGSSIFFLFFLFFFLYFFFFFSLVFSSSSCVFFFSFQLVPLYFFFSFCSFFSIFLSFFLGFLFILWCFFFFLFNWFLYIFSFLSFPFFFLYFFFLFFLGFLFFILWCFLSFFSVGSSIVLSSTFLMFPFLLQKNITCATFFFLSGYLFSFFHLQSSVACCAAEWHL